MAQVYEPGHRCGVCWSRDGTSERHLIHSRGVISCWSGEGSVLERVPCGDQNKFPNVSSFWLWFGEREGFLGGGKLEKL